MDREFFIDNLLVRIHFIIEMIWWTVLAPWEFGFPFAGSLICLHGQPAGQRGGCVSPLYVHMRGSSLGGLYLWWLSLQGPGF